eukprot:CAMPEP_0118712296 /NCGR_PEP_ID=MMETSP0800-20121206/24698_1 /TAXON_ID=210618 ORGANISM="Striatella unipunctata, Strain CCMP2910" /NCGR_SAMPLE_ID=MMETSP0800 /ASSEMBLY_ACC=CAM_ASM_000638 /LENGTH=106 /DNA_ID=CAMNT_0006617253 /DNA_START=40 /DNA_END=360 /DNA_ORIENTATION=+
MDQSTSQIIMKRTSSIRSIIERNLQPEVVHDDVGATSSSQLTMNMRCRRRKNYLAERVNSLPILMESLQEERSHEHDCSTYMQKNMYILKLGRTESICADDYMWDS